MSKLSEKEALVLELLIERGPSYGLALVDASEGALKRGTVYVTLGRMEEKGLVEVLRDPSPEQHSGMARPRYRASPMGARALAAQRAFQMVWASPTAKLRGAR